MNRRGQRIGFVRIIVGETSAAIAERTVVAADMQMVNIFEQVSREKESIDFVLMFGRFGELV